MIHILRVFKGILLGCTAVIPGISIGTMALVLNVYTKIISSLSFFLSPRRWKNKHDFLQAVLFLTPLLLGIVLAMSVFSSILLFLLENYKTFVFITFSGIILGTIPAMFLHYIRPYFFTQKNTAVSIQNHLPKKSSWIVFVILTCIGFIIILTLSGKYNISKTTTVVPVNEVEMLKAFIFGIIGAAAGIIPGMSGSYILLSLGYYSSFLYILSNGINSVIAPLLIVLLLGSAVGLVGVSLGIQFIITKYPLITYTIIFGMIIGSFVQITPWTAIGDFKILDYVIATGCVIVGISLSILSEKLKSNTT